MRFSDVRTGIHSSELIALFSFDAFKKSEERN